MTTCIHICSGREWRATQNILNVASDAIKHHALGDYFTTEIENEACLVYHSGPTKTRASAACQHVIDRWSPDMIYVLGTCGGVSESVEIHDVIMASKTVQYDCHDFMEKEAAAFYGPMVTTLDTSIVNIDALQNDVKIGIIGTADRDLDYASAKVLRKAQVLAADWESGAIAKICDINNVGCMILRGVTDKPREQSRADQEQQANDYKNNTAVIMKKLFRILSDIFAEGDPGTILHSNGNTGSD